MTVSRHIFDRTWLVCLALAVALGTGFRQQDRRTFSVSAHKYAFVVDGHDGPARIEVQQNDLVQITFSADDIPHSFTIDNYRIAKRAEPGKPVTFEFRADQVGTCPFYCNLAIDDGCRKMTGELVVVKRQTPSQ